MHGQRSQWLGRAADRHNCRRTLLGVEVRVISPDDGQPERTAIHEASHAAVSYACGLVVGHMQLFGKTSGWTAPAQVDGQELQPCDRYHALGTSAVAGNLGVAALLGDEAAMAERNDSDSSVLSDDSRAEKYAELLIEECGWDGDVPQIMERFRARARDALSMPERHEQVKRVRDALLSSSHMALCRLCVERAIEGTLGDHICGVERASDFPTGEELLLPAPCDHGA